MKRSKEAERALTPAEERRLAHFDQTAACLEAAGFTRNNLTVGIVSANLVVLVAAIPVMALGVWLFHLVNPEILPLLSPGGLILLVVAMLLLTVVHEWVHGAVWGIFAPNHLEDVEFGFMKQYLTPYCTCLAPLGKGAYILGALAPLVVLGLLPGLIGILTGSVFMLWLGLVMTLAAGGDVMIVFRLLRHKSVGTDVRYLDHPTQAGLVVFER